MLSTFTELYDIHPVEDSLLESLLLVGILKATAVLKMVGLNICGIYSA